MRCKKFLLAIGIVLAVFIMTQSSYAHSILLNLKPGDDRDAIDGAAKDEKLSIYHGSRDLIAKDLFVAGKTFTVSDFAALRREGGRKGSGRALGRELDSLAALGLITRDGNDITVNVTMTQADLDEIDRRCGAEVAPLRRRESGKARPIGFRSFDLTEVANDAQMMQINRIVGEVLLTGRSIQTQNTNARHLNGTPYEKVVTLTEGQIVGDNALDRDVIAEKTENVGKDGVKLAIATTHGLEPRGADGELSVKDQDHVKNILGALPMGLQRALELLKQGDIVFSRVPQDIFAQIEAMGVPVTLNTLSPAQAAALLSGV